MFDFLLWLNGLVTGWYKTEKFTNSFHCSSQRPPLETPNICYLIFSVRSHHTKEACAFMAGCEFHGVFDGVRVCVVMFGHLFQSDTTLAIFCQRTNTQRERHTHTHTLCTPRCPSKTTTASKFEPLCPHWNTHADTHVHTTFCMLCCLLDLTHATWPVLWLLIALIVAYPCPDM